MKVLVACEFSGVVRDAFTRKGHNAWSCDLLCLSTCGQPDLWDAGINYLDRNPCEQVK